MAITPDLTPGVHGWSVLDRLKHNPETRHIPVEVISAFDERGFSLQMGAVASWQARYITKSCYPLCLKTQKHFAELFTTS